MAEALPRVLAVVGTIVAPTTLLTALLFYFGRMHITGMFRHLRVNFTVLDLSFQDYLVRSADGLFVPLAAAACVVLLMVWGHGALTRGLPSDERRARLRRVAPLVIVVSLLLLGAASVGLVGPSTFRAVPELPGLFLAVGVVGLAAGLRLLRRGAPLSGPIGLAEVGAVFVVVAVGLFWSVGNYAVGVGATRGQQIAQSLGVTPDAVLFSERDLSLSGPGVARSVCADVEASYRYRYDGLKLVIQSGDHYLFLPEGWTRTSGAALVIPRSEGLRLEFTGPGAARGGAC